MSSPDDRQDSHEDNAPASEVAPDKNQGLRSVSGALFAGAVAAVLAAAGEPSLAAGLAVALTLSAGVHALRPTARSGPAWRSVWQVNILACGPLGAGTLLLLAVAALAFTDYCSTCEADPAGQLYLYLYALGALAGAVLTLGFGVWAWRRLQRERRKELRSGLAAPFLPAAAAWVVAIAAFFVA